MILLIRQSYTEKPKHSKTMNYSYRAYNQSTTHGNDEDDYNNEPKSKGDKYITLESALNLGLSQEEWFHYNSIIGNTRLNYLDKEEVFKKNR